MSDGVLSTSGSSFAAQVLSNQHQVGVLKKARELEKQEGDAQLKLLNSLPSANPAQAADPASRIGQNINVKA
jgi:hypothetical protein